MAKQWIAFFSQTGSEIVNISKTLGIKPNLICTNNTEEYKGTPYHPGIRELKSTICIGTHKKLMEYLSMTNVYNPKDTLITLHGYLRILPPEICNKFEIYNGHPALITHYPELKGKDPQERTWEGNYHTIGSVVHRVTEGVDEGEVVKSVAYANRCNTKDELYLKLKESSLEAWLWFLKRVEYENRN